MITCKGLPARDLCSWSSEITNALTARRHTQSVQAELGLQLCFVYRHFPPVELYPHALAAAEAAEEAGAQGRFWRMHDMLFQNSPELTFQDLTIYAANIELNLQKFVRSLETDRHLPQVQENMESGLSSDQASLLEALRLAQ
jgi:formate-nitrite transporter family protein